MSELTGRNRPTTYRKAQRGQALIIVLAVMFILLFIGTIFIAQIARNIQQSGRSVQTQTANTLAEAGVRYCDEQLTHTGEGADWRPTPTPAISATDPDYQWLAEGFSRISMNGGRALVKIVYAPDNNDPRGGLLKIESIGRPGDIGTGNDPTIFVQTGAAPRLRKELVAYKQIGLTDYARFITNKNKTNAEAAIGVPNQGAGSAGAPLSLVLGEPFVGTAGHQNYNLPSYPMRINGDVRFYGSTYLYESQRGQNNNLLTNDNLLVSGNILFDTNNSDVTRLFINQPISADQPAMNASHVLTNVGPNGTTQCMMNPSSANPDCNFDSAGGLVRTGSSQPDDKGYTQNIPSLAPPSLDYYDAGTGFLRYRLLTRETGAFGFIPDANDRPTNARFRLGALGWGTGIYVNNPTDYQAESNSAGIGSSYSLRADWLNPKAGFAQSSWQGPYYRPPGVLIELLGDRIRLTRDDNESFYQPDGSPSAQQGSKSIEIPLSDSARKNYTLFSGKPAPLAPFSHDGDDPTSVLAKFGFSNPYKHTDTYGVNVVLMAEGNVRVRGVFGLDASSLTEKLERVHLTIVSGHTAYIEGSIVKGDPDKASTCAILARDYVCVNPTMFMAPRGQGNLSTRYSQDLDAFVNEIGPGVNVPSFDVNFSWGLDPQAAYGATPIKLLTLHAAYDAAGLPPLLNLLINQPLSLSATPTNSMSGFYNFTHSSFANNAVIPGGSDAVSVNTYNPDSSFIGKSAFNNTYALGYDYKGGAFVALPKFEARSFPLDIGGMSKDYALITQPGYENVLSFAVDTTTAGGSGYNSSLAGSASDYALGGAAVTPMDIRIEAMLYAQERSFFVIPGYTFNPDRNDTAQAYLANNNNRPSYTSPGGMTISRVAPDFPYYNEPLDVRITIFGSITENYTASISDQTAWMARWGYIPVYSGAALTAGGAAALSIPAIHIQGNDPTSPGYGNDFRTKDEQTANIAQGMRYLYDPTLALPYLNNTPGSFTAPNALRFIPYTLNFPGGGSANIKLILPPVPKLPVCPGLLYMGTPDRPLA